MDSLALAPLGLAPLTAPAPAPAPTSPVPLMALMSPAPLVAPPSSPAPVPVRRARGPRAAGAAAGPRTPAPGSPVLAGGDWGGAGADSGKIVFYSHSKAAVEVGKGAFGEWAVAATAETRQRWQDLVATYPDFRKMLSNFWPVRGGIRVSVAAVCRPLVSWAITPSNFDKYLALVEAVGGPAARARAETAGFAAAPPLFWESMVADGEESLHFLTAEHLFHFMKLVFVGQIPRARRFLSDCAGGPGTETDAAVVKRMGGKKGVYCMTPEEVKAWGAVTPAVLRFVVWAKFGPYQATTRDLRTMLRLTVSLELWHVVNARAKKGTEGSLQRWTWMEQLRAAIVGRAEVAEA